MYLAVVKQKVVDVSYEPAIPEIPEVPGIPEIIEDLDAVPPVIGVPAVPAIPAVPAVPEVLEVSHEEVAKTYIEKAHATVVQNLDNPLLTYYYIKYNAALRPTMKTVREKSRVAAPSKEIVTIESQDGEELGTGVI